MFQKFLLFFAVLFLCASTVNASMITIDENELAENNTWSFDIPFKEDKQEKEEMFLLGVHSRDDREYGWMEEDRHFDFDRDDRWYHHIKDCEQPSPVPIPGSLLLFVSGIAGLIGLIKHRTK